VANQGKDLTYLFVRDLDDIPLPPRDTWRPAPRKESQLMKISRYVLYAGAIAAVLVIALIASFGLRGSNPVGASPSPTASLTTSPAPTASDTPAVTTQPPGPTAGLVDVCGAFNAYMPASSGRNAVLSMGTPSGLMNFELVLNGTVPPDLQQNGAQLVRLTGRRVQGINTVADYSVVRVSSCSAP
jgi:hypothetical protein